MTVTHEVIGAAVVVTGKSGGPLYLYKGQTFDADAFTEQSVAHALSIDLIREVEVVEATEPEEKVEEPNESWNHARIDDWAAAQDPVVVFTGENPTKAQKLEQIAALATK